MSMPPLTYPVLRLRPKADARRIRHGAPWAWSDDLVLDRRSRAIPAARWRNGGWRASAARAWRRHRRGQDRPAAGSRDPAAVIDAAWLSARIDAAQALRDRIYAEPFYRMIHAEGDGLPGLIVDRFGDMLVMQPNAIWLEEREEMLAHALLAATGCSNLIQNGTARARLAEGLPEVSAVLAGTAPEAAIPVPMNGATYMADVMGGQKTGLFYDQRDNHAFAARLSRGARVLDVFSHVGGFALAALAAGADSAVAIDGSEPALVLAQDGAVAMGVADKLATRKGDAFDEMEALATEGAQFDLVICDPPAFAPSKTALEPGLRAYERVARLAAALVAPGGVLVLCSCSHTADLGKFRAACLRGIGRAGGDPRLIHTGFAGPDHPQHPALTETGYLKALAFRLMP